jgi:lipid A 3-O-deacylase
MGARRIGLRRAGVVLFVVMVLAASLAGAGPARAQPQPPLFPSTGAIFSEIRLGIMAHDVPIGGPRIEDGVDINGEVLFTSPDFLRILAAPRPHLGFTASTNGGMSQVYAGLSWQFTLWRGLFAGFSLGGALHTGPTHDDNTFPQTRKAFGSRGLFRESVEIGWQIDEHNSISIMLDHISNARLASPNPGLDTLGVRYGFRF